MEIPGHPVFLRLEGDTSYYSSQHFVTEESDKAEIIKVADQLI